MAGPRTSLDAAGKKRKQSVDESPAATNQKRLKKEASNATPVKSGKSVVNAATITTPATGSAKKDVKKQGDHTPKEQPSLSKKEQKKLKQEAQQTPVSAKTTTTQDKKLAASTPSKQTQSPSIAAVQETPMDEERRRQRRAEKKARRQVEHEAKIAEIAATPQTAAKFKSAKKPSALAKSQTGKSSAWTLSAASAGRYIERDPIFVNDSNGEQYIAAATAREVQVLSLETSTLR